MKKLKSAIIVDLDGTLTNCDHRLDHLQQTPKDWEAFFKAMDKDHVHEWCLELILAMKARGHAIILLTGRPDDYRDLTTEWLARENIPYEHLFMREASDKRSDSVVKLEFYKREIAPHYEVLFCLEDRASVVAMWRGNGIRTLQCDLGDF